MKYTLWYAYVSIVLVLVSCSGDDESLLKKEESFYINFTLGDSSYLVTSENYQLETGSASSSCIRPYIDGDYSPNTFVFGVRSMSLADPEEGGFVTLSSITVSRRVDKSTLDSADESGYMAKVLRADNFAFPTLNTGYYVAYNPEKDDFVPNDSTSAAYLSIVTKDGSYFSTTVTSKEHADESFFRIDKIVEIEDSTISEYQYIIEGAFKVDIFNSQSGDAELAAGTFRWPINRIASSELLTLCEE